MLLLALANEGGVMAPAMEPSTSHFSLGGLPLLMAFPAGGTSPVVFTGALSVKVPTGVALPVGFTWIWGRPFLRCPMLLAAAL